MRSRSELLDRSPSPARPADRNAYERAPALRPGRMHEVWGDAAAAFAAAQAALTRGPTLWVRGPDSEGWLDPYGLARFFDPARAVVTRETSARDVLRTFEEALREPSIGFVAAEGGGAADLTAGRRLQLAAEAGGGLGVRILAREEDGSPAAETRWRACARPWTRAGAPHPIWRWTLVKNKRGRCGDWEVSWRGDASAAFGDAAADISARRLDGAQQAEAVDDTADPVHMGAEFLSGAHRSPPRRRSG